jgi:hypothetical protein
MILAKPWASLTTVSGWNHPAEESIAKAVITFLALLGEAWVSSVTTFSTIPAAATVARILTRIATVTPATIHAVRMTAAVAGVAVRLCVAAAHVAVAHVAVARIAHPAIAGIAHAIGRGTALCWTAL